LTKFFAVARPRPDAPPVMNAVLPCNSMIPVDSLYKKLIARIIDCRRKRQ
jgi:hypothetical protein